MNINQINGPDHTNVIKPEPINSPKSSNRSIFDNARNYVKDATVADESKPEMQRIHEDIARKGTRINTLA